MGEKSKTIHDLESFDIRSLNWDDQTHTAESVHILYEVVHTKAHNAIKWYLDKRRGRKRFAQWLRGCAALFAALGFMPPVLALVSKNIPGELGYVLFVAAGSCLLLNRALGISSGWIRYVSTAFLLTTALEEFQLSWAQTMAQLGGKEPGQDDTKKLMTALQSFTRQINSIIEDETASWAAQFNDDLIQLEKLVHTRSQMHAKK